MYISNMEVSMCNPYTQPQAIATIHAHGEVEIKELESACMCSRTQFDGIGLSAKPKIKKVIFHDPATIVYWTDDTKTVVKCGRNDTFDKEKGIALCCMKKMFGNKGNYNNTLKKYIGEEK